MKTGLSELSYFPGCSLATSAEENNRSLQAFCRTMGYTLVELSDWNCCGSSSIYGINNDLAFKLSSRNLSLAPPGRPLFIACSKCLLRLRQAQKKLRQDPAAREAYASLWGKPFDDTLQILSFFQLVAESNWRDLADPHALNGLKFVPYYGCMLNLPPDLRYEKNYYGFMEETLSALGAEPVSWAHGLKCCGTYLGVINPAAITRVVNDIAAEALSSGAECIVTPCAMCQLNLEVRCTLSKPLPVLHLTEVLALATGATEGKRWFFRHLIDPTLLLPKLCADARKQ